MSGPDPAADTSEQVTTAVRALLPELRRKSRTALAISAFAAAVTLALIYLLLKSDPDRWNFALYAGFAGLAVIYFTVSSTISAQQSLVMPIIARSIGFSYAQDATAFVQALPKRLLPDRRVRKGEDLVTGSLGAHAIQMAEVTVETGGKNSKTLFKGIVAQFSNRTAMPAFFVARQDKTLPGFFSGGDLSTEGLHHLRDVFIGDRTYGIWTSWKDGPEPASLAAVIEVFRGIETVVGRGAELYAATSIGVEIHLALSHRRDLFKVGGLFPSEERVFADVQQALHDLTVPLTLARALIDAEAEAAKVKGA